MTMIIKKSRVTVFVLVFSMLVACWTPAFAAGADVNDPTLSDLQVFDRIMEKYDNEFGYQIARTVSELGNGELGFRNAASSAEREAGDIIIKAMQDAGLSNVRRDPVTVDGWTFGKGSLVISSDNNREITLSSFAGSIGTPEEGISGEIVFCGNGSLGGIGAQDVKDKIALIELDINDEWWFSQPAYQLERKGAKALIVVYAGSTYGITQDSLNSFDAQIRDTIPLLNISRADGDYLKSLISRGTVAGTVFSDAELEKNAVTGNIVGEIPGVLENKYILIGAHYDGYFHAFQDDIYGVGMFLNVAKMINESGYKPLHTIVFIAFAAEEYGKADHHYDWCIGSWYEVNVNHPDWIGNANIMLNFDTQRPDMEIFNISANPEYRSFFERYALTLNPPAPWVNGVQILGTNGPWSDDYNFISRGIPGIMSGKGSSVWRATSYHTERDDKSVYDPVTFKFSAEHYLAMMLAFDKIILPPFNFSTVLSDGIASLDKDIIQSVGLSSVNYEDASSKWLASAAKEYASFQEANALYDQMRSAVALNILDGSVLDEYQNMLLAISSMALEAYKVIERDMMKLDGWDVVSYGHDIAQADCQSISDAKTALALGDAQSALDALTGTQFGWAIPGFDKEVYTYWGGKAIDPSRTDLYWGTGKTLAVIDIYDVYHAIANKVGTSGADYSAEIAVLDTKLAEAKSALAAQLANETAQVNKARDIAAGYPVDNAIQFARQALNGAYASLRGDYAYSDLSADNAAAVLSLRLRGALDNEDGGAFNPDRPITRAEFAKWLTGAFNLPKIQSNHSDVDAGSDISVFVGAAAKAKLMSGIGNGMFAPNVELTRAEIAQICGNLLRLGADGASGTVFSDVPSGEWYSTAVESAYKAGLVQGYPDGTFAPERSVTRAEAARILDMLTYLK